MSFKLNEKYFKGVPALYETDGETEKYAYMRFYVVDGNWNPKFEWFVCEAGATEDGDVLFFGYVKMLFNEWGYFTLSELSSVQGMLLDSDFEKTNMVEIVE